MLPDVLPGDGAWDFRCMAQSVSLPSPSSAGPTATVGLLPSGQHWEGFWGAKNSTSFKSAQPLAGYSFHGPPLFLTVAGLLVWCGLTTNPQA